MHEPTLSRRQFTAATAATISALAAPIRRGEARNHQPEGSRVDIEGLWQEFSGAEPVAV